MGDHDDLTEMTDSMAEVMSLDGDVDRLTAFYAKWAADYDEDVATHGYGLPAMMVETLLTCDPDLDPAGTVVMDAGCGTGLVGLALVSAGFTTIDGVDLSPEMVEVADGRGVYRRLEAGVDLSQPAPSHLAGRYDVVIVGGVFTVGHIPPESLLLVGQFARPGGLLVVSTRRSYRQESGFDAVSADVVESGRFDLLACIENAPYTMDSTGTYWGYRVYG